MSGAGGAIGLLLGGILTTYVSWRWVLFVNVPIGALVIALAPIALVSSARPPPPRHPRGRHQHGRPGAAGLRPDPRGRRQRRRLALGQPGDDRLAGGRGGAARRLRAHRAAHTAAELPLHLLESRRRSGAYVMMLLLGTALFAVFFFLTLYMQTVWGYSPVRAGWPGCRSRS